MVVDDDAQPSTSTQIPGNKGNVKTLALLVVHAGFTVTRTEYTFLMLFQNSCEYNKKSFCFLDPS